MSLSDLAHLVQEPAWMEAAACRGLDPQTAASIFFPKQSKNSSEARQICRGCAVQADCLDWALSFPSHYDFGIYAGTNANQRRALRRRRAG